MGYREPPEEVWETYWISVYNRARAGGGLDPGLAWAPWSLLGYGIWEGVTALLAETGLPGFVKIAIFVAAFGGLILLLSVAPREAVHAQA